MTETMNASLEFATPELIQLWRRTIVPSQTTDDQFALFIAQVRRTRLDPISRQIMLSLRRNKKATDLARKADPDAPTVYDASIQISIDGARLTAQRTGEYQGQTKVEWCDHHGNWKDVWTNRDVLPFAARVGVYRANFKEPCYAVAVFDSYAQRDFNSNLTIFWEKMPDLMIAKCAEALALRKAFPHELGGLYTTDEMMQAVIDDGEAGRMAQAGRLTIASAEDAQVESLIDQAADDSSHRKPTIDNADRPPEVDIDPQQTNGDGSTAQATVAYLEEELKDDVSRLRKQLIGLLNDPAISNKARVDGIARANNLTLINELQDAISKTKERIARRARKT